MVVYLNLLHGQKLRDVYSLSTWLYFHQLQKRVFHLNGLPSKIPCSGPSVLKLWPAQLDCPGDRVCFLPFFVVYKRCIELCLNLVFTTASPN